jgi:hypothetical protein
MKDPLMTEYELQQPGMVKLIKYLDDRLQMLRIKNDNYKADRSTRGRIAEIKDLKKALYPTKSDIESASFNDAMKS